VDVQNVPEGPFAAQALIVGSNYTTRFGTVTTADHGQIIPITLEPPPSGSVHGTVVAADGATAIPWTSVAVYDAANGAYLTSVYTDQQGAYTTGAFYADQFRVVATAPDGSAYEQTLAITQPGEVLTADFTLPVSVVRGTVTAADGTPVGWPNVFARQTDANGILQSYYASYNDEFGTYLIFGVPVGDFQLTAQDGSGLRRTVSAAVADIAVPVTVDVQLPETFTVTGTFTNAAGAPLVDELVTLTIADGTWTRYLWSDSDGSFVFAGVPVGAFQVQGCAWQEWYVCTMSAGVGEVRDAVVAVDLRLPGSGALDVQVRSSDGSPVTGGDLLIQSPEVYTDWRWFDGASALVTGLPSGTLHVSVLLPDSRAGVAVVTVLAGRTTTVDVVVGDAALPDVGLDGVDTFVYDIACDGHVVDGGTANGSLVDAYDNAYRLTVNGAPPPCLPVLGVEEAGRELVLGPFTPAVDDGEGGVIQRPFTVTRKIFSPVAGGFVRYLELVTNTSPVALPARVAITGNYGPVAGDVAMAVTPDSTADTFGVMVDATGASPVVANVFAGPGAPVPVAAVSMAAGRDDFSYAWQVVIEPGQTVAFLHFGVQRAPADAAAAQAQAAALADLTDPSALDGLSPDELALIVNFAGVPGGAPPLEGAVQGHVFAADGQTPVAGAAVYAVDAAGGRLLATTRTAADGSYRFNSLYLTPLGATITAVSPYDPAISLDTHVAFSFFGDELLDVDLTIGVSIVRGLVTLADGVTPVAGPTALAAPDDGSPVTARAAVSQPDGAYAFVGLPPGSFVLTVIDPGTLAATRDPVTVDTNDSVVIHDVSLPWTAACVPPAPGLSGWWPFEGNAVDAVHYGPEGTLSGGVGFGLGLVGDAAWFDGVDGLIAIGAPAPAPTGAFSIETWVQFASLDTPGAPVPGEQQIVFKRRGSPGWVLEDYSIGKTRLADGDHFVLRIGQPYDSEAILASTTVVDAGRWYHVAATYDGTTARLYVDGMLEDESFVVGRRDVGTAPIAVGRSGEASGDAPCNCAVDELRIFDTALTAVQVQEGLAAGPSGTCTDLAILTETLPPAFRDHAYDAHVFAVGGTAPVTVWQTGGNLPPGLTLGPDGALTGVPTDIGSHSFEVTVADDAGLSVSRWLTIECGTCLDTPAGAAAFWAADGDARDAFGVFDGAVYSAGFAPGAIGLAFSFDGTGGIVETGDWLNLPNTFTIEFWVNPSDVRATTTEATSGQSGISGQRYAIGPEYRYSSSIASAGVSVGTNGISVFEQGPSYLASPLVYDAPISGWTHLAVVYVNGALVRTGLTSTRSQVVVSKFIGNDYFGYGPFAGLVDEIGIYNRALDAAEIAALAAVPAQTRCPVR